MTSYERRYNKEKMLLCKRLRHSARKVAEVMPCGFTDEQFYSTFPTLQPLLWQEICEVYKEYRYINENRKKIGKKSTRILSPLEILKDISRPILSKVRAERKLNPIADSILKKQYEKLEFCAKKKIEAYNKKLFEDTYFIQNVTPSYVKDLITSYFDARKRENLDVNIRYLIIMEAGKFYSDDTIRFLKQVQSGEKNEELRYAAFKALKQMHAPHVSLHHKRDGKMTENRRRKPNPDETPKALSKSIYNADFEKLKEFDIFISHSSQNREQIHDIMQLFNRNGFVCYVDWVSDKEQLKRELSSKETAEVIIDRIKKSTILVYVLTNECLLSKWSPWELGYAYALNKPICVLQLEQIEKIPVLICILNSNLEKKKK